MTNFHQNGTADVIDVGEEETLEAVAPAAHDPTPVRALGRQLLAYLGEDPDRPGLRDTPRRFAESMAFLTSGYRLTPREALGDGIFEDPADEMVVVRDVELYSMCEHHLLPFYGVAHVGYLPSGKIVGLSKLPRLIDVYARRLQVQERLTREIAVALRDLVAPRGVGVVVEARHMCMMMRGVQKQLSSTTTRCLLGAFRDDERVRREFLSAIAAGSR